MRRMTGKDDKGRYYTVEEKILIANEPVNPTTTWIVGNENRRYGSPIDKLGELEDLEEELGCPLEVKCNVVCDSYIYDENGIQYKVVYVYKEHFDCEDPFDNDMGYTKMCAFDWKDYKKTWWLKEDRSE